MVLNRYRHLADPILSPVAQRMSRVHPDLLSWLAFGFAVAAGFLFWAAGEYSYHLLLLAFLAIALNALFDALDGWVARISGKASRRGDFLDHVLDRYADAFIVGGIVLSAYAHFTVGLLALLGVFFTSYMGTQAQALGLGRDYGGILGRADRLLLLILASLAQWVLIAVWGQAHLVEVDVAGAAYRITLLEVLLIWFALAGHITALQRARISWRALTEEMRGEGEDASGGSEGVTVEVGEAAPSGEEGGVNGARDEDGTDAESAEGTDA